MSRLSALHPLSCGGRQRTQNVDASRFPAGIRQGNPGSKYGGLGSAQFRAGRRGQRRSSLRRRLVYGGGASSWPSKEALPGVDKEGTTPDKWY